MAASTGLHLDEWQETVLRGSLGVRADGKWAAFSVGVIVPRQNGKGALLEARALAGLFLFEEELIAWTAHEMKTAKEGFRRIMGLIRRTPDLHRQVKAYRNGNDDRGIELHSGARLQFLARSSGSGRGFTGDCVILDEAYKLDGDDMAALLPTLSAVPNPQIWYTSSAPMATSEQLHRVRKRGIAGDDPRLAFFEWSIPDGADPLDPEMWPIANPAYPHRIDDEAIEAEKAEFSADDDPSKFARERCGVPDNPADESYVLDLEMWSAKAPVGLCDPKSAIVSTPCVALDVAPDRKFAAFGAAGRRKDDRFHVEVVHREPGTRWVLDWAKERSYAIRIQKGSPAESFVAPLREAGVEVVEVSKAEHASAVGQFLDAANNDRIRHLGQQSLDSALKAAQLQVSGDVEVWGRRTSRADVCALVAVTIALGGVPAAQTEMYDGSVLDLDDF